MRSPTRVAHADLALHRLLVEQMGKIDQFPSFAAHMQRAIFVQHSQASRVVAAIF